MKGNIRYLKVGAIDTHTHTHTYIYIYIYHHHHHHHVPEGLGVFPVP